MTKGLLILSLLLSMFQLSGHGQCCNYYLNMTDTYGDGWNGAELELFIDGVSQGLFAAEDYGSSIGFQVCTDQVIDLSYSSGMYENENAYQLFNSVGQVLFSDGPNPSTGLVFTGSADCNMTASPGEVACTALPLDTVSCVTADNTGNQGSGLNPGCANYQGQDIWFQMQVPPSGNLSIYTSTTGGMNDTGLAIWQSTTCTGLNLLACDDDGGDVYFSFITLFNLEPGIILYAQVWAYGGGSGSFQICMNDLGTVILESSELPIVDIYTGGQQIQDEPKIDALMRVIYNGPGTVTNLSDSANVYYGHVGIEIRGATSAGYPQKPYGFETRDSMGANNNVSLLGMPSENDWVLLSNYNDKTFLRNMLSQNLFREMGNYAPRMTLCELRLDSLYQGIYLLGEKIKRDDGRVAIATLDSSENTGDDLTGGYIFKSDLANGSNSWLSNFSPIDHPSFNVRFVYYYPSVMDITLQQKSYLAAFVDSMETALYSSDFADPLLGYRSQLDVSSFIDYFLVNELSRNNDGFKKSRYYHKDKFSNGGKLKAGPTWDFDWAFKNIPGCSVFSQTDGSGWAHLINNCPTDNVSPGWYIKLLQDSTFANALHCRYESLRENLLSTENLHAYIDSVALLLNNAQERHFQKWPTLGINVGTPEIGPIPDSFQGEIDFLKDWIALRVNWLDVNMPGQCLAIPSGLTMQSKSLFKVFPNPSNGMVVFQSSTHGSELYIYDLLGQLIDVIPMDEQETSYAYRFSHAGMFHFRLMKQNMVMQTGSIVIE